MSTNPIGSSGSTSTSSSASSTDPFQKVDLNSFLKLMITELQNQDPTKPMDNSQLLSQIAQMENISSTTKLNTTLDGIALSQNLTSATSMLYRTVVGIDDSGNPVNGQVSSVQITNGVPTVMVGNQSVSLSNISQVLAK